jgi:hypothetical protein
MGVVTRKPWARVCWVALGAAPPSCDVPAEHEARLGPTSSATSTTTTAAAARTIIIGASARHLFIFVFIIIVVVIDGRCVVCGV